jgi:hypothetical protein
MAALGRTGVSEISTPFAPGVLDQNPADSVYFPD